MQIAEISIGYSETASGYYSGNYLGGKVVLCTSYTLMCGEISLEIPDLSLAIGESSHDTTLILPKLGTCHQAATMAASFTDEWGSIEEGDRDQEVAELENFVRSIDGTSSADTLKALISGTSWTTASNLSQTAVLVLTHIQTPEVSHPYKEIVAVDATCLLRAIKGVLDGLQGANDELRTLAEPLMTHPSLLPTAA